MQIVGHAVHLCNSRCSRRPRKGGEVVHLNPNTRPLSLVRIVQGLEKCVVKARQEDIEAVCRKMVGTEVRTQGCVGTRAAHLGLLLVRLLPCAARYRRKLGKRPSTRSCGVLVLKYS